MISARNIVVEVLETTLPELSLLRLGFDDDSLSPSLVFTLLVDFEVFVDFADLVDFADPHPSLLLIFDVLEDFE